MIITCPSCQKKFELDDNLLPENGRTLQCGSCNYKWFFKKKDEIKIFEKQLVSNENEKIDINETNTGNELNILKNRTSNNIDKKRKPKSKKLSILNFFNYLVVLIISFIALIIFLDTFKNNLSEIFPNLELFLYNLFETIKDLQLFFNDLFK
ncbi:zinc-ribbon domain-containing protein [Candidatus Pelagibacter sp.]|nr:zinc-ribbon domain-containing protein [Candidatus Pelagibacter sp.]